MNYKYDGQTEVYINNVGIVRPGDTIKTNIVINNPLFRRIDQARKATKKENQNA